MDPNRVSVTENPRLHGSGTHDRAVWFHVVRAVVARPGLWPTAVRQIGRLAAPGWWRRPPRLPLPPAEYLAFRMQTAYGPDGETHASDVVAYLEWCRAIQRMGQHAVKRHAVRVRTRR